MENNDLDLAVARLEGLPLKFDPMGFKAKTWGDWWVWSDEFPPKYPYMRVGGDYSPSTKWEQGGPIIEREGISLRREPAGGWYAFKPFDHPDAADMFPFNHCLAWDAGGDTALEAAMRCYVESRNTEPTP